MATKILYSKNHNLMRTVGFVTILAAATCLQNNDQLLWTIYDMYSLKKTINRNYIIHINVVQDAIVEKLLTTPFILSGPGLEHASWRSLGLCATLLVMGVPVEERYQAYMG